MIYRQVCDAKVPWDVELHGIWAQPITLHAFRDASINVVSAAVYSVVDQPTGMMQVLVAAKSCLARGGLAIPRLELIGAHMAVNHLTNIHQALDTHLDIAQHRWLDSTVVLYWV